MLVTWYSVKVHLESKSLVQRDFVRRLFNTSKCILLAKVETIYNMSQNYVTCQSPSGQRFTNGQTATVRE